MWRRAVQAGGLLAIHSYYNHIQCQEKPAKNANLDFVAVLSGSASSDLTKKVCDDLQIKPILVHATRFSDGEISVQITESIRGKDCFLIQTCAAPVNDNIIELLLTITAARRSGASSVTVITPYFGYKHNRRGLPISTTFHSRFLWSAASDFGKMLSVMGADKIISVDLQSPGEGHESCMFTIPVESMSSTEVFVDYFSHNLDLTPNRNVVFVSCGTENIRRVAKFESSLKTARPDLKIDTSVLLGEDLKSSVGDHLDVLGANVNGADVIIVDEYIGKCYCDCFSLI